MGRERIRPARVLATLLLVAFVAGFVTCFDTAEEEIARLAGLTDEIYYDSSDWQPEFVDESVSTGPTDDSRLSLWTHLKTVADHLDPHRLFSDSVAGVFEPARDSATIGVAGLGHAQDRESLESDAETITDELSQNPDEVGAVHRPGSPYRPPPSAGHPDAEPHVPDGSQRPPNDMTPLFQHHFNTFFNRPLETGLFGAGLPGFSFFDFHANQPWWKGENVCTEREEKEEDVNAGGGDVALNGDGDDDIYSFRSFGMFNMNVETCTMKHNKYVCTSIKDVNGRRRTEKVTRQCCHGYGRPRRGTPTAHCEKLDLHSMAETAEKLGAKEFIATLKKSGLETTLDNPVTLFVVPDGAYSSFAEQMWENNLVAFDPMARSKRAIDFASMTARDVILAHTVNGSYHIEDVSNEQLLKTDLPGANIRINIYPRRPTATEREQQHPVDLPYRYTANCAPLVTVNRLTDRGIVHVVDRVLVPARNTLMDIVEARDDLTLLRTFLEMTGLDKQLREKEGTFTLFAPNDDAFLKLDKDIRRKLKAGNGCAMNILKNHILDLTFCSMAAVDGVKTSTLNLLNKRLGFEYVAGDEEIMEPVTESLPVTDSPAKPAQRIRINGQATIQESDVMASNGVLHVIDTVLPTDSGMPISTLLANHNLTIFKQLLVDAGLEDEFDDMSNRTFFIPSDQAFEQTDAGRHWIRQLKEHPENLRNNAALREFLEYHVAEPLITTCHLEEKMLPTKAAKDVRVNLYTTNPIFSTVMNRATVNCARLVHSNEETCGSVVHQIDRVLDVPKMNLMEALAANPDYSMFLRMVSDTNLTELLSSSEAGLTVLVPKNDVFLEVNEWYQETLQNKDELEHIIRAHVLPNVICCTGMVPAEWPFVRTTETVGGNQLRLNRSRRPEVENAGITKCDIVAQNGIIHEINDVINVQAKRGPVAAGGSTFPSFGSLARPLSFWLN